MPSPVNNSACKRLNLYLRWMIRKDEIDTGIWSGSFDKAKLIMPVDTHIYRVSKHLGLVSRNSCDLKFAIELTKELKKFDSSDPVKYDFALCHLGIEGRYDLSIDYKQIPSFPSWQTQDLSLRPQDTKKKSLKTAIFVSWGLCGKKGSFVTDFFKRGE
ncbi:MAG: DUF2400 family protein [Ignavibacteria bacterium]|nr:DUF2400 family protein [Ignavibacteria bacterium]